MQLSRKQKGFYQFFPAFSKFTLNFEHFQEKEDPHSLCISEITDSKNVVKKCLKSPVSENLSTSNMVNGTKHC